MGPNPNPQSPSFLRRWPTMLGILLVGIWLFWWICNIRENRMLGGTYSWVPAYQFLGVDFQANWFSVRLWRSGHDPYLEMNGAPLPAKYAYPPIVLRSFLWCNRVWLGKATIGWIAALTVMSAIGAVAVCRARSRLALSAIPWPLVLAAVLFSTPFLYAIERGNCDLCVVLFLLPAAWALGQASNWKLDCMAGACIALAASYKVYPAILVPALVGLGRWRALLACGIAACLIWLPDLRFGSEFLANVRVFVEREAPSATGFYVPTSHTISGGWKLFWTGTSFEWLLSIPGPAAWAIFAAPLAAWVAWALRRHSSNKALVYPYFLWLCALATFLPQISNDYNLVFFPLAVLAVWDRRDPVPVHMIMGLLLLWWQPVALPIGDKLLLVIRLLGLIAVGMCLVNRAREQSQSEEMPTQEILLRLSPTNCLQTFPESSRSVAG